MKKACKWAQQYGPLIGRLLLANLFVVSGFKKITGFAGAAGYMAATMPSLDPNLVKLLLVVTIAVELGGGLMVLIGWQALGGHGDSVMDDSSHIRLSCLLGAATGSDADAIHPVP
jgi:hypothetical protein